MLHARPVEVGVAQVALAQVGVGQVGLAEPLTRQDRAERSTPRSDVQLQSVSVVVIGRSSAPGNCEPVSLQPSHADVEQARAVEPAGQERRPEVPRAGQPHAGEHAVVEHAAPRDQLVQVGVVEAAAGEGHAVELGAPPVDAGEVGVLDDARRPRAAGRAARRAASVGEVARAGQVQRHAGRGGGGDDLLVAHRTAGLDDGPHPGVEQHLRARRRTGRTRRTRPPSRRPAPPPARRPAGRSPPG